MSSVKLRRSKSRRTRRMQRKPEYAKKKRSVRQPRKLRSRLKRKLIAK